MFEEFLEGLLSPLGIAAVFVVGTQTGRQLLRKAFKATVKGTYVLAAQAGEMATELGENAADMFAEARDESKARESSKPKMRRVS